MSSGSVDPPGPTRRRLGVGTILWALIPALSFGFLAPVPFAHAAVRLQQRRLWAVTAAYAIGVVALFVFSASRKGSWGDLVFGTVLFALMIGGTIHAFVLRGRVFAAPSPAVAAALAARTQREEAKAIATGDVALARELRIGHLELPREFDDGGLVDVNHVPARVLVDRLGLSPVQAGRVVQARERLGGFAGPEELIAGSGLPSVIVNAVRERLLFVAVERATDTHDDRPKPPSPKDYRDVSPPGWYPDPAGGPRRRYWNGAHWDDQVAAPTPQPSRANQRWRRIGVGVVVGIGVVLAVLVVTPFVLHDFEVRRFRATLDALTLPPQIRLVREDRGLVVNCLDTCAYPTRWYSTPWSRKQTYQIFAAALERQGYQCVKVCDGFDAVGRSYLTQWRRSTGQPATLRLTADYANANDDLQCFKGGCDPEDTTRPAEAEISTAPA